MFDKNFFSAYIILILAPCTILGMDEPKKDTPTPLSYKGDFTFTPSNLMADLKYITVAPPQKQDLTPREIFLKYDKRFNILRLSADNNNINKRFQRISDAQADGPEITQFLKTLEQIARNNPEFDHLTLTLFDRDKNFSQLSVPTNTEIFHLTVNSINEAILAFITPLESARRIIYENNGLACNDQRDKSDQRDRFEQCRFEQCRFDENNNLAPLKNVLTYINVLQNGDFSSLTFSYSKDPISCEPVASLSYTNHSLVFTTQKPNGITVYKFGHIKEILNDLEQLLTNNQAPSKFCITVGFHDEQKSKFSDDSYVISVDDIEKTIKQFNAEAPTPFRSKKQDVNTWRHIWHNQYIVPVCVLAAVAAFVGLWYKSTYNINRLLKLFLK